ncbi:hypothetical protein JCM18382A_40580 [Bradyrhizobium sp. 17-4]
MRRAAQFGKFRAEFIEQTGQVLRRRLIGGSNFRIPAPGFDDEINGPILQMQPLAVRKKRDLREPRHACRPGRYGIGRMSALSRSDDSGRT